MKLGLVTYNLAKDWDIDTIIANCTEAGFEGVELRTTHAHGVEVELSAADRSEVRKKFEDSPVTLASLGSAFEYHSTDATELRKHIEGTKRYAELARDVGAAGIKVRPNGLQTDAGISADTTLEQIGVSLRECATATADLGIRLRLEVHGRETCRLPNIRKILDYAETDDLFLCWNSNQIDLEDGGLEANFALVSNHIDFVHMRDLFLVGYPWRRIFGLLSSISYDGFCCAEIPESSDPIRVMRYYRALFDALKSD